MSDLNKNILDFSDKSDESFNSVNSNQPISFLIPCKQGTVVQISQPYDIEKYSNNIGDKLKIDTIFKDVFDESDNKRTCNLGICNLGCIRPEKKLQICCITKSNDKKSVFIADNIGQQKQISLVNKGKVLNDFKKVGKRIVTAMSTDISNNHLFIAYKDGFVKKLSQNSLKGFSVETIWWNYCCGKSEFLSFSRFNNYKIPKNCMIMSENQKKLWVCSSGYRNSYISSITTSNPTISVNFKVNITGILTMALGKNGGILIGNSLGYIYLISGPEIAKKESEIMQNSSSKKHFSSDLRNLDFTIDKIHKNGLDAIKTTTSKDHLITVSIQDNEIKIGLISDKQYTLIRQLKCPYMENLYSINLVNLNDEDQQFIADELNISTTDDKQNQTQVSMNILQVEQIISHHNNYKKIKSSL